MIDVLRQVERELPSLLNNEADWTGLDVNYHPPRVERLWLQWKEHFRIMLHRIYPCSENEALFHPHPWPSAMLLTSRSSSYKMGTGYETGKKQPEIRERLIMKPGSRYEMIDPNEWHYVAPIDGPALTVMVTGKPWQRTSPKSSKPLAELSTESRSELFELFRKEFQSK